MSKILLVTGASSDIGCELIRRISGDYDVILAHYGNSEYKVKALIESVKNSMIIPLQADFSCDIDVKKMVDEIIVRDLIPSHFVHLPAIPIVNKRFKETDWEEFEAQINISLKSAYILCYSILPNMARKNYGKIVFMLTENIVCDPAPKYVIPYTTAKSALFGLMRCLAAEYSDKHICINGVSPAFFESHFISLLPELVRDMNAGTFPMKRNLTISEIIPTIEFLLSSGSDALTGRNIAVTGGRRG